MAKPVKNRKSLKRVFQKKIILLFLLPLLFLFTSASKISQTYSEYDLKLVFIEKFTQFIDWPVSSDLNSEKYFTIGIYGKNPFGQFLHDFVKNRKVKGLPVKIELLNDIIEINNQNILFISPNKEYELPEIMDAIKNKPILTISDIPKAEKKGVLINFYLEKEKIKFYINNNNAISCGFKVYSPLLKIATLTN